MHSTGRRNFLKFVGATAAVGAIGPTLLSCSKHARVVVIGGGFGGTTVAKYLRRFDNTLKVTLIEPKKEFITCPFSNAVIAGLYDMSFITHGYDTLQKKHGVEVIHDMVAEIDGAKGSVKLASGKSLEYDKLVVSPGIELKWGAIPGYDEAASELMPHSWQGGPQTMLLRKQLEAMEDGGVVIIAPPADPFRCPPGPYERASLIAHYLKTNKPKSKILILDAKDKFSKQPLFQNAWNELYPGMIEWLPGSQGGKVERVDPAALTVVADDFEHKGAVVNVIPPQSAGAIAVKSGLTNEAGWCPVNQKTFESALVKNIHVIGDACIAGKMPKSGYSANSQAKVCAAEIVAALNGKELTTSSWINTCYSLIAPDYGISVADVYRLDNGAITNVAGAGGIGPVDAPREIRTAEANYAVGWYQSITADMFG